MSHLFCFGLGYCAEVLAHRLAGAGWQVSGTAATADSMERIGRLGYAALPFDGSAAMPSISRALMDATHVLVSVPPGENGDPVLRWHAADLAGARHLQWIGYLSTVGVYGDHGGGWVDEETPTAPLTERSRWRVAAESEWLALGAASGKRVEIFRLAGIYGPGRSVIDDLRRGTARRIVKPGQVFNRIHVDDIATTLQAAMDRAGPHRIYNVADDEPSAPQAVLLYAARLLQVAPPDPLPFDLAELTPMARSFYTECKRVSNRRIKTDLDVTLAYPTFREGLSAILRATD
jgi:nucleoside-diphosphate-sugar epimerase